MGSLSNCVEIASRWHKPQKHFSPVHVGISQAMGNAFQHFYLGITTFGKAAGCPVFKIIQYLVSPAFQGIAPLYEVAITCQSKVEYEIIQNFGCLSRLRRLRYMGG
jgi:hypothetical protein